MLITMELPNKHKIFVIDDKNKQHSLVNFNSSVYLVKTGSFSMLHLTIKNNFLKVSKITKMRLNVYYLFLSHLISQSF